jgi:hypothetical protein
MTPGIPPPGVIALSGRAPRSRTTAPLPRWSIYSYGVDFAMLDRQSRPGRASPGLLATYPQALVDNFVHRFIPMLWITFSTGFPQGVDNARTLVR